MRKMRPQKQLLQFVMLSLLSVVSVLVTSDESFAALACYSCHGQTGDMRPLDTPNGSPITYRNITTGAVKGNHSKHMVATTDPAMCSRCHNNSGYPSSHRDGKISLKKGMNGSSLGTYASSNLSDGGTYVFKNQTSVPTLGSCANVNCHFESVTPTWGSDTTNTTCNTCHSSSPSSGSHTHHINQYALALGSAAATCVKCHAPRVSFQHATSAGNVGRTIDLSNIGGTYTGSNGQYLPSQSATRQFGSCNTIYCHSSGQSSNGASATPQSFGSPQWNNMGSGSCGTCHEVNLINTGSHGKHVAADNNCGNCHSGATAATINSANHVNGFINVSGSLNVKYLQGRQSARGNGYDKCSNATCHAPTTAAPLLTPTWGTAASCSSCHDLVPATGSHSKHISTPNVTCSNCHTGALVGSTGGDNHLNGTVSVAGGYAGGEIAKHAAGSGYKTCSAAACHANPVAAGSVTTPTWGVTAAPCTACHSGVNAITAQGPANGSHGKHMAAGAACVICHNTGTTATTMPSTGHTDGNIDVINVGYPANKAKGSAYTTCSAAVCHGNPVGSGTATTPTWGATVAPCTACHGGANAITTLGPVNGSHTKHMSRASITCTSCHNVGTTATSMPGTGHADGNIDIIVGGYPANKAKGSAYASCTNVCHSGPTFTAPAVTWGATVNCTSCHNYPPATNHNDVTPGSCNGCHSNVAPNGISFVDNALHMNGIVEGGNCNACHGYPPVQSMVGLGTNANYSTARLQNYSGGGGVHNVAGHLALTVKPSQFTDGFTPCLTCHPKTVNSHNQGGPAGFLTANVQVVVDAQYKFDKNRPIVYNAKQTGTGKTSGNCTNVACHFQKTPIWSTQTYTQGH